MRTFNFCALQFLNQWLGKEAIYCESLASNDITTQRNALVAAGGHFRVARNLPTIYETEYNLQRYEPVLYVLNEVGPLTADNVTDIVNDARQRISFAYGKRNVLSLTTKFLWLKFQSPVRIYDRQVRIALGTREGNYLAFNDAFTSRYAEHKDEIETACGNLSDVISYSIRPNMEQAVLEGLVALPWFRERVLDIYLWNQGNA